MATIPAFAVDDVTPPTSLTELVDERVLVSPVVLTQTVIGSGISFVGETEAVGYAQ